MFGLSTFSEVKYYGLIVRFKVKSAAFQLNRFFVDFLGYLAHFKNEHKTLFAFLWCNLPLK